MNRFLECDDTVEIFKRTFERSAGCCVRLDPVEEFGAMIRESGDRED